jgi:hypothetical protein
MERSGSTSIAMNFFCFEYIVSGGVVCACKELAMYGEGTVMMVL